MIPWIELGCAPDFDQGIKLSGKVPFVTFEQLGKELPSDKAQTDYRNIILRDVFKTCPYSILTKGRFMET